MTKTIPTNKTEDVILNKGDKFQINYGIIDTVKAYEPGETTSLGYNPAIIRFERDGYLCWDHAYKCKKV